MHLFKFENRFFLNLLFWQLRWLNRMYAACFWTSVDVHSFFTFTKEFWSKVSQITAIRNVCVWFRVLLILLWITTIYVKLFLTLFVHCFFINFWVGLFVKLHPVVFGIRVYLKGAGGEWEINCNSAVRKCVCSWWNCG